ncbi:MAG: ImmA/IrrE family metallo-endopeptidase [Lachnospiraceae bacterium]
MTKRITRLVSYYTKLFSTNDPFKIAKNLGIFISFNPLGNIAGMYKYIEHAKWIFINSDIEDENFLRIVMAHELGHALLHRKENCCFMAHHTLLLTSKIERQANIFAAKLLISDDMLNEYKGFTIDQFSSCTGIDNNLIELRLNT